MPPEEVDAFGTDVMLILGNGQALALACDTHALRTDIHYPWKYDLGRID
jgi:hypothetical protein